MSVVGSFIQVGFQVGLSQFGRVFICDNASQTAESKATSVTILRAVMLLAIVAIAYPRTVLALTPNLLSTKYTDQVRQLEAEVEAAWSYLSDLRLCIIKHERRRHKPEEIEKAFKEEYAQLRRNMLDKDIAKSGGNPAAALAQMRDGLIYVINDTAINAAAKLRLAEPKLTTIESIQATVEDETIRTVPLCDDVPSDRSSSSAGRYTSPNQLFSVGIPKSSNWARVPFSIAPLDTKGDGEHDQVMFHVRDFGAYLVAGVQLMPPNSLALIGKDGQLEALRSLSLATLMGWRADLGTIPSVARESFVESPHGQAIVRVYRAEKGSLLVSAQGRRPTLEDTLATNIASILARKGAAVVYVLAQNDGDPNDTGSVEEMAASLFRDIAVMPERSTPISSQTSVTHLENCINWGKRNDRYGTLNDCDKPVSIQFMLVDDGRVIKGEVAPGAWFDTGLTDNQLKSEEIWTACPFGYIPSVPFSVKYKDEIQAGRYECLKK